MKEIWLTADELAKVFKIKKPTVRLWTKQGMPHLRCGRLVRFNVQAVTRWLMGKQAVSENEAAGIKEAA
jgi:excisionase family DNA binding protein